MKGHLQRAFGRGVRRERLRRGLSQKQWAEVLHIHRTFAGAIERGERNLTLGSVERLAETMGIEPLVLLEGGAREVGASPVLRAAEDGGEVVPDYREAVEASGGRPISKTSGSVASTEEVASVGEVVAPPGAAS